MASTPNFSRTAVRSVKSLFRSAVGDRTVTPRESSNAWNWTLTSFCAQSSPAVSTSAAAASVGTAQRWLLAATPAALDAEAAGCPLTGLLPVRHEGGLGRIGIKGHGGISEASALPRLHGCAARERQRCADQA